MVIIGNGPAAVAAAEAIREHDRHCEIIIISKEAELFYSPCPLAEYVEDSVPRDHLFLRDENFYRDHNITTILGRPVTSIDTAKRRVMIGGTGDPASIPYERLLIASGAAAFMPPVSGLTSTPGVFALKTIADADGIVERLPKVRHAVVIGSGFIGLEAAQALIRRGVTVTVVEALERVLPQMLDEEMAAMATARLRDCGIEVRVNCLAEEIIGGPDGARAVLAGGSEIACELVVCAAGVRADLSMLAGSGLETDRGLLVNKFMETSQPDVYAAGDIVEGFDHHGQRSVVPIWPNAVNGGRVAGRNMVVARSARLRALDAVNIVRIFDVPVASFGKNQGMRQIRQEGPGVLRKLSIDQGRIVGAEFFGEVNGTGMYHEMMIKEVDVSGFEDELLSPEFGYGYLIPQPPQERRMTS